jgi:hypothetical protein
MHPLLDSDINFVFRWQGSEEPHSQSKSCGWPRSTRIATAWSPCLMPTDQSGHRTVRYSIRARDSEQSLNNLAGRAPYVGVNSTKTLSLPGRLDILICEGETTANCSRVRGCSGSVMERSRSKRSQLKRHHQRLKSGSTLLNPS